MAAHRYWRLYFGAGATNYGTLTEVAFRSAVQGANQCSGGTPGADSEYSPTYAATKALDANTGTYWSSTNTAHPHWWKYDLGSGNDKEIIEVNAQHYSSYKPTGTLKLQYSDDGSAWSDYWSIALWTLATNFAYTWVRPPTSKQLWRVNVTAAQGAGYVYCAGLKMRESAGGADQCSGGTAQGSEDYSLGGFHFTAAFDGNGSTYWSTNAGAGGVGWLGYAFTSAKEIVEFEWTGRPTTGNGNPTAFDVQYWDGSTWVTAWSGTSPATWTASEARTFTKSAAGSRPVTFAAM